MKKTNALKKRKLDLSKETVRALSVKDMNGVAGGIITLHETEFSNCSNKCSV